jgi:hypothetical protein
MVESLQPTTQENDAKSDTMFLDEEHELYGYGIMNVAQNALMNLNQLGVSGSGYFGNDVVTSSKKELKRAFANMVAERDDADSMGDISSFRVVQVRLGNSLDRECAEIGDKLFEMAESGEDMKVEEVIE